jgi:hypothetical protein
VDLSTEPVGYLIYFQTKILLRTADLLIYKGNRICLELKILKIASYLWLFRWLSISFYCEERTEPCSLKKMIKMRMQTWAYLKICAIEKYIFHLRVLEEVSIIGYVAPRKWTSVPFTMKNPWGFSTVLQGKITRICAQRGNQFDNSLTLCCLSTSH